MLYLVVHIALILCFFQLMRFVQARGYQLLPLIAVNYISAALIAMACILIGDVGLFSCSWTIGLMGSIVGVLYVTHLLVMFACIRRVGVGISATVASVSAVSPVLFASLFWNEVIDYWQISALMLVPFMMYLCRAQSVNKSATESGPHMWLVLNFIIASLISICHDVVDRVSNTEQMHYLAFLFCCAGVAGLGLVVYRRMSFAGNSFYIGSVMGICNVLATLCALQALMYLSSVLVFPVAASAIIVGSTALAYFFWKEKIIQRQIIGMCGCLVVIVLINMQAILQAAN